MGTPSPSPTLYRLGICLLVLGILGGCRCTEETRSLCPDDTCEEVEVVPDAGESCVVPCGTRCCGEGHACEDGLCRPTCERGASCLAQGLFVCCDLGEVCTTSGCVAECPRGEYCPDQMRCDAELGACIGDLVPHEPCVRESTGGLEPELLWAFTPTDGFDQVMTTPLVVDVDRDGVPEVIAAFFDKEAGQFGPGIIRALSGRDGSVLWTSESSSRLDIRATTGIAAGELVAGGGVAVVAVHRAGHAVAIDGRTGKWLWNFGDSYRDETTPCVGDWGAPAIADLDGDGVSEVACGTNIFEHHGRARTFQWTPTTNPGAITIVADFDGDRRVDVSNGSAIRRGDGTMIFGRPGDPYGFGAVGDLVTSRMVRALDGLTDVVNATNGTLTVRSFGGQTLPSLKLPRFDGAACTAGDDGVTSEGGPPAVGDVDGDGHPEIVVTYGRCLSVIETFELPHGVVLKARWSRPILDTTSDSTGAVLFDFDGDGAHEIVHADELVLRVLDGHTGEMLFELPTCSGTASETPVVADIDGNGAAELLVGSSTYASALIGCEPGFASGLRAYRSRFGTWANARPVWNQHGYHPNLVCDGSDEACDPGANLNGRVAPSPRPMWPIPGAEGGHNVFRANTHGVAGPFGGSNLQLSQVVARTESCPSLVRVVVRVENRGLLAAPPGVELRFARIGDATVALGVAATRSVIPPGGYENVAFDWAPPPGALPATLRVTLEAAAQGSCGGTQERVVEVSCG